MKINVRHIAKLANLTLQEEEIDTFESQLSDVLGYIEKLNEVDTTSVDPTSQVTGLKNIFREDSPAATLSVEKSLSNAKSRHSNFFMVKGIMKE